MFAILQTCMYIYSQQHLVTLLNAQIPSVVTQNIKAEKNIIVIMGSHIIM